MIRPPASPMHNSRRRNPVPDVLIVCYCDASESSAVRVLAWRMRKMYAGIMPNHRLRALTKRFDAGVLVLAASDSSHVQWAKKVRGARVVTARVHVDATRSADETLDDAADRVMRESIHALSRGVIPVERRYPNTMPLPDLTWEEEWMHWIDWDNTPIVERDVAAMSPESVA